MNPYLKTVYINSTATGLAAVFLVIILISSFMHKKESLTRRPFCVCTTLLILLLTESAASWVLDGIAIVYGSTPVPDMIRYLLIGMDYLIYGVIDDFFFLYLVASVRERRSVSARFTKITGSIFRICLSVSLVAGGMFIASIWTERFFTIDEYGGIIITSAYPPLFCITTSIAIASLSLIIRERKTLGKGKTVSCLLYLIVPLMLVCIDVAYRLTTSYVCCAVVIITIYIAVDLKRDQELLEREADISRSEAEKADMKVSLMMSQIQPHFLYNALSSIAYLCRKDPKEAELAVNEFADYLRMNLRSINTNQPIPFEMELNHVENFLKLQKRRFPDQIHVVYDIRFCEFRIPALTLQPIVENAVKHGAETRFEATTIRISSKQTEQAYIVTVQDDGPGFDVTAVLEDDRPHIGIASTRSRLANQVGGALDIHSIPGVGTAVTITIPKRGETAAYDPSGS